jgi:hypothetical protein
LAALRASSLQFLPPSPFLPTHKLCQLAPLLAHWREQELHKKEEVYPVSSIPMSSDTSPPLPIAQYWQA